MGREVKPSTVTRPMLVGLGVFMPLLRELRETLYQWEQPRLVDDTKFRAAFGAEASDADDGIRRTLEWFEGPETVLAGHRSVVPDDRHARFSRRDAIDLDVRPPIVKSRTRNALSGFGATPIERPFYG